MIIRSWPEVEPWMETLLELDSTCFGESCWDRGIWKDLFENRSLYLFPEFQGARCICFAVFANTVDESELLRICVDEKRRSMGMGRSLLEAAFAVLTELNIKKVHLEVRSDNRSAVALYKGLGFQKTGIRRAYYANPPGDALTYLKEL